MSRIIVCLTLLCIIVAANGKQGYGVGEQDWGWVDVRTGAHMFYWLYYTTAKVSHYTERPLAIWLQGGPGASSTGYGNFEELGPLDLYGNYRNHTWVKDMNVLFIDNPVGSGFSYVNNVLTQLTTTNNQIALDLVALMKGFYELHPEFIEVPLHIFCESYGGKMAPEFALELYKAIQRGDLQSNFQSVNLGDPWTSPIDSVLAWAPLLLNMGIVDQDGYENIMAAANKTEELVNDEKWTQATTQWGNTQQVLLRESKGVDFYNILKQTNGEAYARFRTGELSSFDLMYKALVKFDIDENRDQMLEDLMRGPVSEALGVPSNVKWGSQGSITFTRLMGDFMKPVIHIGKQGFGSGEQDWGWIDVRTGAHMFYWLYYTTAKVPNHTDRPLAIWLQGGPGASSTGYGNFEELGPLDLNGNYRESTWVKDMNVLFIDNPVGSGFSYVDDVFTQFTRNNKEIALDLVEFMKGFYKLHPEFIEVPLHIFCESYGGKMAPEFALELYKAIQHGYIRSNLQSVNLGDPWTSPIDSVLAWGPLLLQMGIIDEEGYERIMVAAKRTEDYVNNEEWIRATLEWSVTQQVVLRQSKGVDFYNIEKPTNGDRYKSILTGEINSTDLMYRTLVKFDIDEDRDKMLEDLMRGPVSEALGIPPDVVWGIQGSSVFSQLSEDFMKPVIHIVEELLNTTNLRLSVYSGHLDLICATPGTVNWINKMAWSFKSEYERAARKGISVKRILEGYEKTARQFSMFWINRAGHMVPADNPDGMDHILRNITKYNAATKFDFL